VSKYCYYYYYYYCCCCCCCCCCWEVCSYRFLFIKKETKISHVGLLADKTQRPLFRTDTWVQPVPSSDVTDVQQRWACRETKCEEARDLIFVSDPCIVKDYCTSTSTAAGTNPHGPQTASSDYEGYRHPFTDGSITTSS